MANDAANTLICRADVVLGVFEKAAHADIDEVDALAIVESVREQLRQAMKFLDDNEAVLRALSQPAPPAMSTKRQRSTIVNRKATRR